ncbi:1-phosphofructokinase family hexose kinase [Streptomyces meridianus]|uniref:1-phosphofructokinase family hexose kinase n=1 Tax=Streptomyces meridianus TaxID=2938945 RepID=A0ABT0X4S3_9ACTN|nr:1-phosphofructokinase family hexose kinase [Streptomyces meridianus]MCM2577250.1 1-phosphofructokinase family hexose kinase [Streptomyces meridianus]
MILTVTLNAALDITYRVPRFEPSASHRVSEVTERPGGKGLNVARVLAALGHRSVVTGFAGGPTGDLLRRLLAGSPGGERLEDALTPISGETRRTVGVADTRNGGTTQFNEPGPVVTRTEWDTFCETFRARLGEATAVALCGSLPPGLPVGSYATLVRAAQSAGVPVLLDTSGEPLRRGIAARPDLVKPNTDELTGLTGFTEPVQAAREARRRGARAVAASLGAEGMLVATADGGWRAAPPRRIRGNATGAGDSAVAGLLSALAEGQAWPQRLARAVALSAATVLAPAAGEFDRSAYEDLLPRIDVRACASPVV